MGHPKPGKGRAKRNIRSSKPPYDIYGQFVQEVRVYPPITNIRFAGQPKSTVAGLEKK